VKFILLYRGPGAWLVWLARLIGCVTLWPILVEMPLWLFTVSRANFGETGMMIMGISMFTLRAIAHIDQIVYICVPAPIAAFVLLLNKRIPLRVRLLTAGFDLAACALLVWDVSRLRAQLNHNW